MAGEVTSVHYICMHIFRTRFSETDFSFSVTILHPQLMVCKNPVVRSLLEFARFAGPVN